MFQKAVDFICELEEKLNLELYLVGGAVRDLLLDQEVKDYDFTTPCLPDEVEQKIIQAGFKPYLIGKKFGTIGVKYKNEYIEITTFRNEIYSQNNRKPIVEYHNDIKYDLERRDLTINAIALSSKGELIDLFGGENDLKAKIVKCVGNPELRFEEDALRMLRAIRFASAFEFKVEKDTLSSIKKNYWRLLHISKERWVMEMDKILSLSKIDYAFDLLLESGLLSIIIQESSILDLPLWQEYGLKSFWSNIKTQINSIHQSHVSHRWAVLISATSNLNLLSNILNQEKFNNSTQDIFEKYSDAINQDYFQEMQIQSVLKSGKFLKFSNQRLAQMQEFLLK